LCDLLTQTGVAGRPASYYRKQSVPKWSQRLGVADQTSPFEPEFEKAYLEAVTYAGSDGTGVFGLRVMWETVPELREKLKTLFPDLSGDRSLFERGFGKPFYIQLVREDKLAQAISRFRAERTGRWHLFADGSLREQLEPGGPCVYDRDEIARLVVELEDDNRAWQNWFRDNAIEPFQLKYEDLAEDPVGQLERILHAMGAKHSVARNVTITSRPTTDEESQEWYARFVAETA
jgi:LPS sulfotransferase NodH